MTNQQLKNWLDKLKNVLETKSPDTVVDLCANKFLWYETPFDQPLKTKEQLLKEWQGVLNQENITVSYEVLSVNGNMGLAQWSATFTRLPSMEQAELDGIFKVSLNEKGECTEFHQWYNAKEQ